MHSKCSVNTWPLITALSGFTHAFGTSPWVKIVCSTTAALATSQALPYPTSLAMMNIKMSTEELFSFRSQRTFGPCEVPPTILTHLSFSYTCQAWRGSLILPQTHPTPQHTPPNPEYSRFIQLKIKVVLLPIESHGDIGHRATDTRPTSTVFQPHSTKARRALCTSFMLCT